MKKQSPPKHGLDNRANQLNPMHPAYHLSRGAYSEEAQRLASEAQAERAKPLEPEANPASGPKAGGAQR